jgi:hypothetical protein
LFQLFATDGLDTGGKLTTAVVDTGGNLPLVLLTQVLTTPEVPVQNLLLVSLIPVVHLDLRISQLIFERNLKDLYIIFRGLEGDAS